MFAHIEAVFLDLDGTLIDSVPDLTAAVDAMLVQLDLPPRGEAKVRQWVGNGADNLIRRALTDRSDGDPPAELFEAARPLFKAAYRQYLCVHSRLYGGVAEGLNGLRERGLRLACITNKPAEFALPLIERMGIGQFFDTLVGGDCTPNKKPAPDALLLAAERLNVPIERALMVGDSSNDVGAARNAGCPVVAVPYGYNHGRDIREAQPDAIVESIAELPALLQQVKQVN